MKTLIVLIITFVVYLCMYNIGQTADYPSTTTNLLTVDLDFNGKKISNIGDIIAKWPLVDVRAYGAKGDGTTNDTTAIQNAINSLPAGGGTVFLPPGTYMVDTITLNAAGIVLSGAGRNSTVIKKISSASGPVITNNATPSNIYLHGAMLFLTVDGNNASAGTYGINVTGLQEWEFFDVRVRFAKSHGWFADCSGGNPLMTNLRFVHCQATQNGGDGFYFSQVGTPIFDHCHSGGNTGYGYFVGASEGWFSNLISDQNTGGGYYINGARIFMSKCWAQDNAAFGMRVNGGNELVIEGCYIADLSSPGRPTGAKAMAINGIAPRLIGNRVVYSYPANTGLIGIQLEAANDAVLIGNEVDAGGSANVSGIDFSGAASSPDTILIGNNLRTVGIPINNMSNNVTALGNRGYDTPIRRHLSAATTLDFGAPATVPGSVDLTITVTGAAFGDTVTVGSPVTVGSNYLLTAFVSANDTVKVRWTQIRGTAANPDGTGGTYRVDVWKH